MSNQQSEHYLSHGGNLDSLVQATGRTADQVLDFSASLNPAGPPDFVYQAYLAAAADLGRYPDPASQHVRTMAAVRLGVTPENLVFGNGEDELIFVAIRTLVRGCLLIFEPSYGSYRSAATQAGLDWRSFRLEADQDFRPDAKLLRCALADLPEGAGVCLGSPNNPTGVLPGRALLADLIADFPHLVFLIDEAFIDVCIDGDNQAMLAAGEAIPDNLIVLRSLTKTYAIPGLRLGYAIAAPAHIRCIRAALQSWPLSAAAESVGRAIFSHPDGYIQSVRALIRSESKQLWASLSSLGGLRIFPSSANFLLLRLDNIRRNGQSLPDFLATRGIAVRSCANMPGLDEHYIRVAVRTTDENSQLVAAIGEWLGSGTQTIRPGRPARTPALMIQGCSSSTGKSLLTAAFCRIFHQDGLAVLPYKAQNMSLNARVTADGGEIGVAQYVQAQAARAEPDVRMNPVLLKPHSDTGAKIIVLGKPWGQAEALAYGNMTETLSQIAFAAYDELAATADVMVLEGAGSPAEINLRERDFVNMAAAIHADARVLLAGDIDRGGVFASFIGHVATFRPEERRHLLGFIVNKFRGDARLLGDAYALTQRYTGFPVLGTVPFIPNLAIDEEDGTRNPATRPDAALHIAVIRLPHVSNAQDFDPLSAEDDVSLEFVATERELAAGVWDAVILPGSRATVSDLNWLRSSGIAAWILAAAARGVPIIGICGGLQMLGRTIADQLSVESEIVQADGLGLLDIATDFQRAKVQTRSRARHVSSGLAVDGYEIRHGGSTVIGDRSQVLFVRSDGQAIGFGRANVWGCYLHGIFESDEFRSLIVNGLRRRQNLAERNVAHWVGIETELDRLAEVVRASCDLPRIYQGLGLA